MSKVGSSRLGQSLLKHQNPPLCALGTLLSAQSPLEEDSRADLALAVTTKGDDGDYLFGGTAIQEALAEDGHKVSEAMVRRHRGGLCRCGSVA